MRNRTFALGARAAPALFIFAFSGLAAAQAPAPTADGLVRPTAKAVRIETGQAPTIDGDLSDPVWAQATIIDN